MSHEEKKRWFRYQALLKLREPYEMSYWKQKMNTPYKKLLVYIKQLIGIQNVTTP